MIMSEKKLRNTTTYKVIDRKEIPSLNKKLETDINGLFQSRIPLEQGSRTGELGPNLMVLGTLPALIQSIASRRGAFVGVGRKGTSGAPVRCLYGSVTEIGVESSIWWNEGKNTS
eukprot:sb/3476780/